MAAAKPEALLVGHLCLDMFPKFPTGGSRVDEVLIPGRLIDIDGMELSTGGSANNTGQAMHNLGFNVRIVGKLGDDMIGRQVLDNLRPLGESVINEMIISPGEESSFTVILNPPGIDRIFLHSAATNNTFVSDDLPDSAMAGVRVVHYGYPPLMASFFKEEGIETKKLLSRVKAQGLTSSLDMARPDPAAASGRVDWIRLMENVLPHADLFLPSVDEIVQMLHRKRFDELIARANGVNLANFLTIDEIRDMADWVLARGPALVGFKLGDQGFYLKTTNDRARLAAIGPIAPKNLDAWVGRELAAPCFQVKCVGTTGAGDATIGGFLGAMLKGLDPEDAVIMAVGTGGESVEAIDSASAVQHWDSIVKRIADGWPQAASVVIPESWVRGAKGTYSEA